MLHKPSVFSLSSYWSSDESYSYYFDVQDMLRFREVDDVRCLSDSDLIDAMDILNMFATSVNMWMFGLELTGMVLFIELAWRFTSGLSGFEYLSDS